MRPDEIIIINLSGRGDKDVGQAADFLLKDRNPNPSAAPEN
jgi:tryptophan synthase beta subunit